MLFFTLVSAYRLKARNNYHRSKMFEYELLSQISMVTPIGTTLGNFLSEFGLKENSYRQVSETSGIVSIKPFLVIPINEQRDYTGFSFHFKNNKLIGCSPNGPQPEDLEIDLSKQPIGKKLGKWQRP